MKKIKKAFLPLGVSLSIVTSIVSCENKYKSDSVEETKIKNNQNDVPSKEESKKEKNIQEIKKITTDIKVEDEKVNSVKKEENIIVTNSEQIKPIKEDVPEEKNKKENEIKITTSVIENKDSETKKEQTENNLNSTPSKEKQKAQIEEKQVNSNNDNSSLKEESNNQTKENETVKNEDENIEINKIRIGHWNVLNETGSRESKTNALAKIINYNQISIIGLTEISNDSLATQKLLEAMQKIDPNGKWKSIHSNVLFGKGKEDQKEWISILYKSSLTKPIPFVGYETITNPYMMGLTYENPKFKSNFSDSQTSYVRPPFGARFQIKNKEKTQFTFVLTHNDSPGPNSKRKEKSAKGFKKQGTQEIDEALRMKEVMDWFDSKDGENNSLIFMGDTNIKEGNGLKAFKPLTDAGFISMIDENNKTSMSNKSANYASPYDKIYYKNINLVNGQKYNIWNVFQDAILNEQEFKEKVFKERGNKSYSNELSYIRSGISDHAPIFADLILNNQKPTEKNIQPNTNDDKTKEKESTDINVNQPLENSENKQTSNNVENKNLKSSENTEENTNNSNDTSLNSVTNENVDINSLPKEISNELNNSEITDSNLNNNIQIQNESSANNPEENNVVNPIDSNTLTPTSNKDNTSNESTANNQPLENSSIVKIQTLEINNNVQKTNSEVSENNENTEENINETSTTSTNIENAISESSTIENQNQENSISEETNTINTNEPSENSNNSESSEATLNSNIEIPNEESINNPEENNVVNPIDSDTSTSLSNENNTIENPVNETKRIKLSYWNISTRPTALKNDKQVEAIAKIIINQQVEAIAIIGFSNIKNAPNSVLNKLIELDPSGQWKLITENKVTSRNYRYTAIFFKESKVNIKKFVNQNEVTALNYNQNNFEKTPFGIQMQFANSNKTFTLVLSTLDKTNPEVQEIPNLMEWFDTQDEENQTLLFLGTTQISNNNIDDQIQNLLNNNYKKALSDDFANKIDLKKQNITYTESTEQIFYKNANVENVNKFDLINIFNSNILDENFKNEFKQQQKGKKTISDNEIIKAIAANSPIIIDLLV